MNERTIRIMKNETRLLKRFAEICLFPTQNVTDVPLKFSLGLHDTSLKYQRNIAFKRNIGDVWCPQKSSDCFLAGCFNGVCYDK